MKLDINNFENSLFEIFDQVKVLISQDTWENILLNCTKNEIFVLMLMYKGSQVNMSQIADYLGVPLNTATGIVSRMEKKDMIQNAPQKTHRQQRNDRSEEIPFHRQRRGRQILHKKCMGKKKRHGAPPPM